MSTQNDLATTINNLHRLAQDWETFLATDPQAEQAPASLLLEELREVLAK